MRVLLDLSRRVVSATPSVAGALRAGVGGRVELHELLDDLLDRELLRPERLGVLRVVAEVLEDLDRAQLDPQVPSLAVVAADHVGGEQDCGVPVDPLVGVVDPDLGVRVGVCAVHAGLSQDLLLQVVEPLLAGALDHRHDRLGDDHHVRRFRLGLLDHLLVLGLVPRLDAVADVVQLHPEDE